MSSRCSRRNSTASRETTPGSSFRMTASAEWTFVRKALTKRTGLSADIGTMKRNGRVDARIAPRGATRANGRASPGIREIQIPSPRRRSGEPLAVASRRAREPRIARSDPSPNRRPAKPMRSPRESKRQIGPATSTELVERSTTTSAPSRDGWRRSERAKHRRARRGPLLTLEVRSGPANHRRRRSTAATVQSRRERTQRQRVDTGDRASART